jgi:hypothetical protein
MIRGKVEQSLSKVERRAGGGGGESQRRAGGNRLTIPQPGELARADLRVNA